MADLAGAVVATSLVLAVVFIPALLVPGSIGRLYEPIAVVISGAILFSTLNALTFTPMACAQVLGGRQRPLPGPAPGQLRTAEVDGPPPNAVRRTAALNAAPWQLDAGASVGTGGDLQRTGRHPNRIVPTKIRDRSGVLHPCRWGQPRTHGAGDGPHPTRRRRGTTDPHRQFLRRQFLRTERRRPWLVLSAADTPGGTNKGRAEQ